MFGPLGKRPDGTAVFASPIQDGHIPLIALEDLGFFARYTFDHRAETSGRDLEVGSEWVSWDTLVATFTKVTGQPAAHVRLSLDEWMEIWDGRDIPIANERIGGPPEEKGTTWESNFRAFWAQWRDDVITRDWEWIRKTNPGGHTLESWMRAKNYQGVVRDPEGTMLLKNIEDAKGPRPNLQKIAALLK